MKTITFYSYKGGVGRSLALSNIAKRLAEFGKKVCIIDFDLDAPGIDHKFGEYIELNNIKKGIVDYIYSYVNENDLKPSIADYVTKINFNNKNLKDIDLIAAGNTKSQEYWKKLSTIYWGKLFYDEDSNGVGFFLDMQEKIKRELAPDFLLIDSKTGITDISGITMSILADEIVLLCANNKENTNGIKQIINTISEPSNNFKNIAPKFHVVLSRIPYILKPSEKYKEENAKKNLLRQINENLRDSKRQLLDNILVLHSDPELEYEEKLKIGYDESDIKNKSVIPLAIDYLKLFEAITKNVLSLKDKQRFNTIRKSEVLLEEAKVTKDTSEKIKLLKESIEINPTSDDAYFELAAVYLQRDEFKEAIEQINKSIDINPKNFMSKIILGMSLAGLADDSSKKQAIAIFEDILKTDKNNWSALRELGEIYSSSKKYDKALEYYNKLVEIYPYSDYDLNCIANIYKKKGAYPEALDFTYKALEINPQNSFATGTLAEIQGHLGNDREFYKNLDLFFSFNRENINFIKIISEDKIYDKYKDQERFYEILKKYGIEIDF